MTTFRRRLAGQSLFAKVVATPDDDGLVRLVRKCILMDLDPLGAGVASRALQTARQMHTGQERSDGRPYIVHPMRVALLVKAADPTVAATVYAAAFLHDALEDTDLTEADVETAFGGEILIYLRGLTRYHNAAETNEQRWRGKERKWQQTMRASYEVRLVKTADYLDNVISIANIESDRPHYAKIARWLREAHQMYLPLAEATHEQLYDWMKMEVDERERVFGDAEH